MKYKLTKQYGKFKKGEYIYCIPLTDEEKADSNGKLIIDKDKLRELFINKQIKF